MFGAGLDGVDPAPLALVEVGGRQQIADRQNSGQRRAHLMRERRERRLDDAGSRRHGGALARAFAAASGSALFRRPLFGGRVVRRERDFAAMIPLTLAAPPCHGRARRSHAEPFCLQRAQSSKAAAIRAGRPGAGCRPASRPRRASSRKPVASVDFESFRPASSRIRRWWR